ncbi:molybdopterin-guanine dinucleotide biosynthesis protein B [Sporosarcina sp. HYO08]|uniref:molybdopterin-guanine dinucleotide biosynthesis protein B n=1 Tax=Sporosarcina sp. HYO08 TaxID=1759557 RepID=UPI0020A42B79|nr:molybdopterin-guanine dinucleotide biosynthesis protein B [Sporosarcina sp. HYO08]
MKVLHVIGFKNSGKTTLIARWVQLLQQKGLEVAVLKHHGHAESLAMPDASTDSMQFFYKGAMVSVAAGGGSTQLMMNKEMPFETLKELAATGHPDILFIEGYKKEKGDKIVLLRDGEDWQSLQSVQGLQLIVGCTEVSSDLPKIATREEGALLDRWLLEWLGKDDIVNETI